ncbi:hypothetical protein HFK83_03225 [Ralstonia pseudosolanacearum]|uniref:hypothetical protein n=1 Tax=Ralstonia pseudosolanacearum TaxID=1310165 RepID=UPI002002E051|nr:hypothetical protein [Ralstonia pseudosolanacearum]MCK4121383.1 hypothetical protein [Ralstonia pseudosolanacearum]
MTRQTYGALCALAEQHGVKMTEEVRAFVRAVEAADSQGSSREDGLAAALLEACKTLPEGYNILLDVEKGWGGVKLIDSNGDGVDYDNGESSLTEQVIEATKTAIAYAGKEVRHD